MKKLSLSDFKKLINGCESQPCIDCEKEKYQGWGNASRELVKILEPVGEFVETEKYINKNGYKEYHPSEINYCSKDAPIAISYYPYHESIINRCKKCGEIFLCYTEYGGHAPQNRVRWVRKDLVFPSSEK